jgi:glycosyltransferase involved in cell wall biosynthesis
MGGFFEGESEKTKKQMKKILIISFSDLNHDARVLREVDFIKEKYQVTVAAYGGKENNGYELIKIEKTKFTLTHKLISSFFLLFRFHKKAYSLIYQYKPLIEKCNYSFDLIIANDVESLPVAFELKKTAKIIFDAHEYAPRHFEDKLMWRIFFQPFNIYICKTYIPQVNAMITVGKGIAEEYKKNFKCNPFIINNATWQNTLDYSLTDPKKIRMIHHGGATVSRNLENMIEMMKYLDDRFTLDLMLVVSEIASTKTKKYINHLKDVANNDPRIKFLPPVKSNEVVSFINRYDIGIILIPPVNFNYANGLPNKLFEFIQAKLAVATGPIPEVAEIVNNFNIGVVSEDFTPKNLSHKLSAITNTDLINFKKNSVKAAINLSAEKNSVRLNEVIIKVLDEKNEA